MGGRKGLYPSEDIVIGLCYVRTMEFETDKGQPVEINFQNFEKVLPGDKPGFTRVKFKSGKEEWIKATEDDIVEASAEE